MFSQRDSLNRENINEVRWGILGAGSIAHKMAGAINKTEGAKLVAVGSRSQAKAEEFAAKHGAEKSFGDYESLAAATDLDVIYVATPHPMHAENTIMCLEAGKGVLCEKPFCMNAAEAQEMAAASRRTGCFLMEAMWSRFLPALVEAKQRVEAGEIGEPRMLVADFGFRADYDPTSRLFSPALGGGALLDVGVYVVSLSCWLFGIPTEAHSVAEKALTGVDEQMAISLRHAGGQVSSLTCATRTSTRHEAVIYGTKGSLKIPAWWHADRFFIGEEEVLIPTDENGFVYEVQEVVRCLQAGEKESPLMPLDETVAIMRTLDRLAAI